MARKFTVIVTVEDEELLLSESGELYIEDGISHELNWLTDSGLSAVVTGEITEDSL